MVEFAIVGSLFVVILLGIGEFGLATWSKHALADAAREGTRWATVRGQKSGQVTDAAGVSTYVKSRSQLSPLTVSTVWTPNNEAGSTVAVTVSYDFKRVGLMLSNRTFTSTSRMVIVY